MNKSQLIAFVTAFVTGIALFAATVTHAQTVSPTTSYPSTTVSPTTSMSNNNSANYNGVGAGTGTSSIGAPNTGGGYSAK